MASAQVDAATGEEVIVHDKNSAEESYGDEQTLPKSIEESEVVIHDQEDDELGEVKNFEDEEKYLEDKENLNDEVTDSPIIGEDEPNSAFDDDDAEDDEESDKI